MNVKRLICILMAIVLCFYFIPNIANAEETTYNLFVNGHQFSANQLCIQCGEGTAEFNPTTNTLTLNNATIDQVYNYDYGVINSLLPQLTIVLKGTNILDGKNNNDGIDAAGGCNITITGEGTLVTKDIYYGTYIGSYDAPGGDLTIKDTTITIPSANCAGLWVNHDINIINSTINILKDNENYNGIVSNIGGTITIDGGEVIVETIKSSIHFGNTDDSEHAFVLKKGNVKLTSRDNYGIFVQPVNDTEEVKGVLEIRGGSLTISSNEGASNIPTSKIKLSPGFGYSSGTSIVDSGKIVIEQVEDIDYIKGDLDRNGIVDANDASIVLEIYKADNALDEDIEIGDMDGNNLLDANDASLILELYKTNN